MAVKPRGITDIGLEGQGKEIPDAGTPFCPLSGITESPARLMTQYGGVCAAAVKVSVVVRTRTWLRGACQALGSDAAALRAVSAILPQTCSLPSVVFWGNSYGSKNPLPSLSIALSVWHMLLSGQRKQLLNSKPTFPICVSGDDVI